MIPASNDSSQQAGRVEWAMSPVSNVNSLGLTESAKTPLECCTSTPVVLAMFPGGRVEWAMNPVSNVNSFGLTGVFHSNCEYNKYIHTWDLGAVFI